MKKTIPLISLLVVSVLLLSACAAAQSAPDFTMEEGFATAPPAEPAYDGEIYADETVRTNAIAGNQVPSQVERIVIKNASLRIAVADPSASVKTITLMAEGMGGFVVNANVYRTTIAGGAEVPRASITVRVPAERLNEAMETIKAESDQPVMEENVNSQDVTEDYTDLQSRLRNLEATETKLMEIMDEARQTEDVLAVFQQLSQVQEQIEVTKGRIQFYEQSAAMSSITVELLANAAVQPISVGGWQPVGVARQALQSLVSALQVLADIVIYFVLLVLPVMVLVLLPPGLILWGILRWRARRKVAKAKDASTPVK